MTIIFYVCNKCKKINKSIKTKKNCLFPGRIFKVLKARKTKNNDNVFGRNPNEANANITPNLKRNTPEDNNKFVVVQVIIFPYTVNKIISRCLF